MADSSIIPSFTRFDLPERLTQSDIEANRFTEAALERHMDQDQADQRAPKLPGLCDQGDLRERDPVVHLEQGLDDPFPIAYPQNSCGSGHGY